MILSNAIKHGARLCLLVLCLPLHGETASENLRLRILAELAQQQPVQDLEATEERVASQLYFLRLSFLVENVSKEPITVASSCEIDAVRGCERFLVSVNLTARGGIYPKPTSGEIGLITINEGEFALLGEYSCRFEDLDKVPPEVFATYVCDGDIASFYPVWTGSIRAEIETLKASELR